MQFRCRMTPTAKVNPRPMLRRVKYPVARDNPTLQRDTLMKQQQICRQQQHHDRCGALRCKLVKRRVSHAKQVPINPAPDRGHNSLLHWVTRTVHCLYHHPNNG